MSKESERQVEAREKGIDWHRLGSSHQTGWIGLEASLIDEWRR